MGTLTAAMMRLHLLVLVIIAALGGAALTRSSPVSAAGEVRAMYWWNGSGPHIPVVQLRATPFRLEYGRGTYMDAGVRPFDMSLLALDYVSPRGWHLGWQQVSVGAETMRGPRLGFSGESTIGRLRWEYDLSLLPGNRLGEQWAVGLEARLLARYDLGAGASVYLGRRELFYALSGGSDWSFPGWSFGASVRL